MEIEHCADFLNITGTNSPRKPEAPFPSPWSVTELQSHGLVQPVDCSIPQQKRTIKTHFDFPSAILNPQIKAVQASEM